MLWISWLVVYKTLFLITNNNTENMYWDCKDRISSLLNKSVSTVIGYWLNKLCLIQCRGRGFIFNTTSRQASGTPSGYWPKHPYWLLDPSRVAYWPKRPYWLWDLPGPSICFLPACLCMELKRSEHETEYFLHVVTKFRKLEAIFPHCHMLPRCDVWLGTVKSHTMQANYAIR